MKKSQALLIKRYHAVKDAFDAHAIVIQKGQEDGIPQSDVVYRVVDKELNTIVAGTLSQLEELAIVFKSHGK